jgi:ABC-type lipoprotein export system ATPase subunit
MNGPNLPAALPASRPASAASSGGEPFIRMDNILKVFKSSAGEFTALKNVNAEFYQGEFVSIVGKSGSGKSTLANMITGIDHPTSGSVCIGDVCVHELGESKMSVWRGRNLGIVFQFFQLLPMLTLLENVILPMDFANQYAPGERTERALALLELVGLRQYAGKLPAAVSGGQQQAAAVARALANDPPVLIADEPTGNLDSVTAEAVFSIFTGLAQQGKTILMVTHDSSLAKRTGRTLIISDGELIDERISQALPDLPHSRLLWLAHQARPVRIPAGELLYRDGKSRANAGLFILRSGRLCVDLAATQHCLGPGEALSALDIEAVGDSLRTIRAAEDTPVELYALDHSLFQGWLSEARFDHSLFAQQAERRQAEWGLDARPPRLGWRSR